MKLYSYTIRFATYRDPDDVSRDGAYFVTAQDLPVLVTGRGDDESAEERARNAVSVLVDTLRGQPDIDVKEYLTGHGVVLNEVVPTEVVLTEDDVADAAPYMVHSSSNEVLLRA